jgi:hypothetical protein
MRLLLREEFVMEIEDTGMPGRRGAILAAAVEEIQRPQRVSQSIT